MSTTAATTGPVAGPSNALQRSYATEAATDGSPSTQPLHIKSNGAARLNKRQARTQRQPSLADQVGSSSTTKNVVVIGGSYGGMHAASVLAQRLPPSHRVILIERNSHFNHLYVFPRFSTLPGHEHKAFIPYSAIFKDAPKRISRQGRSDASSKLQKSEAAALGAGTAAPTDDRGAKASSAEQMLGMGSVSGDSAPRSKTSSGSDSSDDGNYDRVSRMTSSASRSSSEGSLFERDEALRQSRRSTAASSYASLNNDSRSSSRSPKEQEQIEEAQQLAGAPGLQAALPGEGKASRAEEVLGRPEIEVEDLSGALERGINLDGGAEGAEQEAAEGDNLPSDFHDASPHIVLQASVTGISPTHVVVETSRDPLASGAPGKLWSIDSVSIPYSHLVYALGSHLPDPLRTEARTKPSGMSWMRDMQERVKISREIVLVGGGALGVEFATDIKSIYPDKDVTLIHSRKQLLPNFDMRVHDAAYARLTELGVKLVLGERLALSDGCPRGSTVRPEHVATPVAPQTTASDVCPPLDKRGEGVQARNEGMCLGDGRKRVKTTGGREFECDLLLLCTGQQPNSSLMAQLCPTSVDPATRLVRVHRSLQVKVPDPHDSLAQMPFDARPPCGDCDCFLDKKAAGATHEDELDADGMPHHHRDGRLSNVYAIGDVADAFGALNAGYQAWNMADVAAENILRDIKAVDGAVGESDADQTPTQLSPDGHLAHAELQEFHPHVDMLKLSLGLGKMVLQNAPTDESQGKPVVEVRDDPADLSVEGVWQFMAGMSTDDLYL